MRKQTIIKIFAIILCVALLLTCLVACKPKEIPKTAEEIAAEAREAARNDLGEALANSIDTKLQDGFNINLSGNLDFEDVNTTWAYGFKIEGNVMAPPKAGEGKANNDFTIEITRGEDVIFGLYNDGTDMYVSVDTPEQELTYSFGNAPLFESLRYVLAQNLGDSFTNLPSLGSVAIEGSTLGQLVKDFVPILISQMDTFDSIVKEGNVITVDLDLHKLLDLILPLLGNIELDILPETAIVGLTVEIKDKNIASLNAEVYLSDANNTTTVNFEMKNGNKGLFGAINEEYAIDDKIVAKFADVEQTSLVQLEVNGTLNLMSKGEVVKVFDWSFKAKLDVAMILAKNFMLDDPFFATENNFFHFQLTHTCGKHSDCGAYCDSDVLNSIITDSMGAKQRTNYKNGSVLDILWNPANTGSSNIIVDISLFDIIGMNSVMNLLAKVLPLLFGDLGEELPPIDEMVESFAPILLALIPSISGHVATSIDTNALLLKESIIGNQVSVGEDVTPPKANPKVGDVADLDINGIIGIVTKLLGTVSIGDGVTLDINALSTVLGDLLGITELIPGTGIGLPDIFHLILGSTTDAINLAGANGIGSYVGFEFGNVELNNYNAYEAYANNINGVPGTRFNTGNTANSTVYGGAFGAAAMPIMYIDSVEKYEGTANMILYTLSGGTYTALEKAPTSYEFQYVYNMGKSLYVHYNYIGIDKNEYDHYVGMNCINGLDLTKATPQAIKIGTGLITGKGFDYIVGAALSSLLPISIDFATLIPLNTQVIEGNILITPSAKVSNIVVTPNCTTAIKATADIQGLKATATYMVDGVKYSTEISGDIDNLPRDVNGQIKAGNYIVNYNVLGAKTVAVEITVTGATVSYDPTGDALKKTVELGSRVSDIDFGNVVYTYSATESVNVPVSSLIENGLATVTATKGLTDGVFTRIGTFNITLNVNNTEIPFAITVTSKGITVDKVYTISYMINGNFQKAISYDLMKNPDLDTLEELIPKDISVFGFKNDGSLKLTWYTDAACTKPVGYSYLESDIILYGKLIEYVSLTWEMNFADGNSYSYTEQIEKGGMPKAFPTIGSNNNFGISARGNQWIAGWTPWAGGAPTNLLTSEITENTTYYASFKTAPTITFKTGLYNSITTQVPIIFNPGIDNSVLVAGSHLYRINISNIIKQYTNVPDGGYSFINWYTNAALTTAYDGYVLSSTSTSIQLYAEYNDPRSLTISYNYTGLYEEANISNGGINISFKSIDIYQGKIMVENGKFVIKSGFNTYPIEKIDVLTTYKDCAIDSTTGAITWGDSRGVTGLSFTISINYDGEILKSNTITVKAPAPLELSAEFNYTGQFADAIITQGNITLKFGETSLTNGKSFTIANGALALYYESQNNSVTLEAIDTTFAGGAIDIATGAITWGTNATTQSKGIELKITIPYRGVNFSTTFTINAPLSISATCTYTGTLADAKITNVTIDTLLVGDTSLLTAGTKPAFTINANKINLNFINKIDAVATNNVVKLTAITTTFAGGAINATTGAITWGTNATTQAKGIELKLTITYSGFEYIVNITINAPAAPVTPEA